jgi:hypothetical protein
MFQQHLVLGQFTHAGNHENPTCLWHICSQAEKSGGGQLHIDLPFSKIGGICPAHLSKIDALRFDATCYLKTDDCSFL